MAKFVSESFLGYNWYMKISFETNRNIIFFESLYSYLNRTSERLHPLGEEIHSELEFIKDYPEFENLKKSYENDEITKSRWRYLIYAIHTDSKLSPKDISSQDSFSKNSRSEYKEKVYPFVHDIYQKSQFSKLYSEMIHKRYREVTDSIEDNIRDEKVSNLLTQFWRDEIRPELIFVPNPLRLSDGSAVSRKNTFYCITGAIRKGSKVDFDVDHIISNMFHEYSHLYLAKLLVQNENISKSIISLCHNASKNLSSEELNFIYSKFGASAYYYFEENFIRAVQVYLTQKYRQRYKGLQNVEDDTEEWLTELEEKCFKRVKDYALELNRGTTPLNAFISVPEKIHTADK